ncbi:MAG: hypothetical protein O7G85_10150, partial [Planctomycetota bacterium]|nr:hypothetical protein [Planctomycetota bacterium]
MRHATPLLHRAGKSGITLSFGLVTMLLLMALLQGAATPIQDDQDDAQQLANDLVEVLLEAQEQGSGKEEEFDETEIFFEENATDGDL